MNLIMLILILFIILIEWNSFIYRIRIKNIKKLTKLYVYFTSMLSNEFNNNKYDFLMWDDYIVEIIKSGKNPYHYLPEKLKRLWIILDRYKEVNYDC